MKSWFLKNKAAILNILMLIVVILQSAQGQEWLDPKLQAMIITIVNAVILFLRQPVATLGARLQARRLAIKRARHIAKLANR